MNRSFDFTAASPPRLTQAMLAQEAEKRRRRQYAFLLSFASLCWNAAAAVLCCALLVREPRFGAALLFLWGVSLIGTSALSAILLKRKDVILWP